MNAANCKLDYEKGTFYCLTNFNNRNIPKSAGFRWNSDLKVWYTPYLSVAVRLREFATERAKSELNRSILSNEPWLSPLPETPNGLALHPYQEDAVRFALARNRSYLALDPGLGKTACAAVITKALFQEWKNTKAVYICPPFLLQNTFEEFKKWAPDLTVNNDFEVNPAVIVAPDSMLTNDHYMKALQFNFPLIVFIDEAHRFKNETAQRTKALFEFLKTVPGARQVFMSGTPAPNRPMELYTILSSAAPETIDFMDKFNYGKKYCNGHHNGFGWDFTGASNVTELASRVVGKFMLRTRKDVLDLPPKIEQIFTITDTMSLKLVGLESGLRHAVMGKEDLMKALLESALDESLHLATYRRLIGMEKIDQSSKFIKSVLDETDESMIVFAYHKDVIKELVKRLADYNPLLITGETPVSERQSIVKEFQESKTRRLIIGNYQAMGVGFTLTKAQRVVFVEFSWVPGENDQASDRAHRIGQKSTVLVQYMVYKDSIDKAVIETLLAKRKVTKQI